MAQFSVVVFGHIFIICIFVFLVSCIFIVKSKKQKTKDDFGFPYVVFISLLLTGNVLVAT